MTDPVGFLVAFLTGVTASMGLGGGFVLVLWLTVFVRLPQLTAQGINLLFFLPIAAVSLVFHIKGKLVETGVLFPCVWFELAGVLLGVFLARGIDTALLSRLFACFVIAVGLREGAAAFRKPDAAGRKNRT